MCSKILALCLSVLMLLVASVSAQQRPGRLLIDFRDVGAEPEADPVARLPQRVRRAILLAVLGTHLSDESKCDERLADMMAPGDLAAARAAGQIVPRITSVAGGSFTAPRRQQTAVTIRVGECNASHADNYGSSRLAVFEGGRLVADFDTRNVPNIIRISDINEDGVNELLLGGQFMQMGIETGWAKLVDVSGGRPRVVKEFPKTVEGSCGSGERTATTTASAIYYSAPGGSDLAPAFRVVRHKARCDGRPIAKTASKKKR